MVYRYEVHEMHGIVLEYQSINAPLRAPRSLCVPVHEPGFACMLVCGKASVVGYSQRLSTALHDIVLYVVYGESSWKVICMFSSGV